MLAKVTEADKRRCCLLQTLCTFYAPSGSQKGSSISSKFFWVEMPSQGHLVVLKESLGILAISPTPYVGGGGGWQSVVLCSIWGSLSLSQTLYVSLGSAGRRGSQRPSPRSAPGQDLSGPGETVTRPWVPLDLTAH